uniref:Putative secreted protein n=1 Tax=Anopheles darlingi TaxID=43151 RepID=A0A2M4D7K0_ANODA
MRFRSFWSSSSCALIVTAKGGSWGHTVGGRNKNTWMFASGATINAISATAAMAEASVTVMMATHSAPALTYARHGSLACG